ncbi:MAG TPA: M28 family peptidase, partial [bacterium]
GVWLLIGAAAAMTAAWAVMISMPGPVRRGPWPPLSGEERRLEAELRDTVELLAGAIGERHAFSPEAKRALGDAADALEGRWAALGLAVRRDAIPGSPGTANLQVEVRGERCPEEVVVVGAHYDSVWGSPGANDNASGVAALLALAARLRDPAPERTLRFVAFANEEPPAFQTAAMGSLAYARAARASGARILAMLSLETLGYYSQTDGSQRYPSPFGLWYPSRGDFLAFVGNLRSRRLVRDAVRAFRAGASLPAEGIAAPGAVPGVSWSDHWAFWSQGYPAIMVTDTALYRDPAYHTPEDRPERLDYASLARAVAGLEAVVRALAACRD